MLGDKDEEKKKMEEAEARLLHRAHKTSLPAFLQRTNSCREQTKRFFKKYWLKMLAFLVLGILALIYTFQNSLQSYTFKGVAVSEFIGSIFVSWAIYETLSTIQSVILWVLKRIVTTGYWYIYFFTSAFEYQVPWFFWAIIEVYYIKTVANMSWTDGEMYYILKIRDFILSICIGYSIRNLVLKWLFWEVHQKKLSDKMKKYIELDTVLTMLFEAFVVGDAIFHPDLTIFKKAGDEKNDADQYAVAEEDDVVTFDYTKSSGSKLAIEGLRQMQEFEESQKAVFESSTKILQLRSQEDAIEAANALFSKMDTKEKGWISWRVLDKILPLKHSKALHVELSPMFPPKIVEDDEKSEKRIIKAPAPSPSVPPPSSADLTSPLKQDKAYDPDEKAGDEVPEEDLDIEEHQITMVMLSKVFLKLYSVGQSLFTISSAWEELSSGLKVVVDVCVWIGVGLFLLIDTQTNWISIIVTISSLLVSSSFAFGDALSRVVLSLSFVFVSKPYEVGDGVSFNAPEPPLFYVEKINVFSTSFRTVHNRRFVYPNWLLSEIAVYNLSRNKVSKHDLFFQLEYNVPQQKLKKLKKSITAFLKKNAEAYAQDFWFVTSDTTVNNYVQLQIRVGMKNSFDQSLVNASRRSDFLMFFRDECQKLDITYKYLVKPIEITSFEEEKLTLPDAGGKDFL